MAWRHSKSTSAAQKEDQGSSKPVLNTLEVLAKMNRPNVLKSELVWPFNFIVPLLDCSLRDPKTHSKTFQMCSRSMIDREVRSRRSTGWCQAVSAEICTGPSTGVCQHSQNLLPLLSVSMAKVGEGDERWIVQERALPSLPAWHSHSAAGNSLTRR